MSSSKMCKVSVGETIREYPAGTSFAAIARDFQPQYPHDILLVERDGKLCELHNTLKRDCVLRMLTLRDRPGMQTYERSLTFLMLRAFHAVLPGNVIRRISVEYSLSHALFIRAEGDFELTDELLSRVEVQMRELVRRDLAIEKKLYHYEDAVELFRSLDMPDKVQLLRFRRASYVNVYTLDGFSDYFYGYMLPSTGFLRIFALEKYRDGFILRMPSSAEPDKLAPFTPSRKVYDTLYEDTLRGAQNGISNLAGLNERITQGQSTQLILTAEALMEKRIGDIAQQIASRKDVRFVMIAGPSSSGKTTFSHRLSTQLMACGLRPHAIATDNYFVNRDQSPRDANGNYDFESLGAMDVEQFNLDMTRLLRGETVELPHYNFKKGAREYTGDYLTLAANDILVIEGIHCLNDKFSYALPAESKYRIYISCLTTLNIDDHNRIPTTDARLLRRIERDARTRGYSAQATIRMWPNVRKGEEENIFPYQDSADVVFNSALIYETALLKPYIEPLLIGVPESSPENAEAKRLLKFLDYFMPVTADHVPQTSLLREFIGGGVYDI